MPSRLLLLFLGARVASAELYADGAMRVTTTIVVSAQLSSATWTIQCGETPETETSLSGGAPYKGEFEGLATKRCDLELRDSAAVGFEWRGFGKRVVLTRGRTYVLEAFDVCNKLCCHARPNSATGEMVCGCQTPEISNAYLSDTVAHEPPGSAAACLQMGNSTEMPEP